MNLFLRAHCQRSALSSWSLNRTCIPWPPPSKRYSTRRSALDPSLLSLDTKRAPRSTGRETVGPFQLGVSQSQYGEERVKKWSELSAAGKGTSLSLLRFFSTQLDSRLHSPTRDCPYNESYCRPLRRWSRCCLDLLFDLGTIFKQLSHRSAQRCL